MKLAQAIETALLASDPVLALDALTEQVVTTAGLGPIVGFGDDIRHKDLWRHTRYVVAQTPPDLILRYAALFHDVGKPSCYRSEGGKSSFHGHEKVSGKLFLRWAKEEKPSLQEIEVLEIYDIIVGLGLLEGYDETWTDSAVRRLGKELGPNFIKILTVARADCTSKHDYKRKAVQVKMDALAQRLKVIQESDAIPQALPKGLGNIVMETFGVKQKALGQLMKKVGAAVEAGQLPRNSADPTVYVNWLRENP